MSLVPFEVDLKDHNVLGDSSDSLIVEEMNKLESTLKHGNAVSSSELESLAKAKQQRKKSVRFEVAYNKSSSFSSLNSSLNSTANISSEELNVVVKPILKTKIAAQEIKRLLQKEQKRQNAVEKLQERSGSVLMKFNSSGEKQRRHFYISEDGSELQWKKHRFSRSISSIDLASVRQMIIGPRTDKCASFDWLNGKPWLCFSLVTDSRTVDVECKDVEEFDTWFQGLNVLVPLSRDTRFSRGKILWQRALIKSIQISVKSNLNSLEKVWQEMVTAAYRKEASGLEKFLVTSS